MQSALPETFHPAVRRYFAATFGNPTPVQSAAWSLIAQREHDSAQSAHHALISAPTGEGKTLAAFLAIIDGLVRRAAQGENIRSARILYISPLKALSNDIEKNLRAPLAGIHAELAREGIEIDEIQAMVRTGDSSASERARLVRLRPQIVVTTPESLYLLLTSVSGRVLLSTIETVIIDEIHALVANRRGAHLALSLARLENLRRQAHSAAADGTPYRKLQRIGISATVRPLDVVARYLAGDEPVAIAADDKVRPFDIQIVTPRTGLSAVMSGETWDEIYQRLADEIRHRRTTLIFVNNRRLSERLARHLSELIGAENVASHHGSLSHAQRHRSEQLLKEGKLRVMVATSSLELGLDIGSIDLVVQISSPRSIHAFIQRAGRSEHHRHGTSRALLIPLSRDDLLECVALVRSLRQGELEQLKMCPAALDVLAQQIVAEVAMRDYAVRDLLEVFRSAPPYRDIDEKIFCDLLQMLNDGYSLRFGRRSRYIFYDRTDERLHARPVARLTAALNGGAIPENFEYEVVDEKEQVFVGTVHEDFAIESMAGDVFQLGNRMWQITSVRGNRVSVFAAPGKHPTIPFWIVDVPGRSDALSHAVQALNESLLLCGDLPAFERQLIAETGLKAAEIHELGEYLRLARESLGTLPTAQTVVLERFFDEVKNCHIVLHSPFGTQINRAWGLALRKRFCRKFNFELQAAANDSAIILSLSHTHSFILDEVFTYLSARTARDVLIQALLDAPMFEIRWRWNASRALAILRRTSRGKTPAQWQKSAAQDLVALLFPDQIACAENLTGPRDVPDHPLVKQTLDDCLHEAMDVDGLLAVLQKIENGEIRTVTVDSAEPSHLAHEIINARPYAFLDDAPLEDRRTRAVRTNFEERESHAESFSQATLAAVRAEALYPARNAYELYDRLTQFCLVPEDDMASLGYAIGVDELRNAGKALPFSAGGRNFLASADKAELVQAAYHQQQPGAVEAIVLAHLELISPQTTNGLAHRLALSETIIAQALLALENAGSVFQIEYAGQKQFVERAFYQRLLHYDRRPKNRHLMVSAADYVKFLHIWQHAGGDALAGPESLRKVLLQLQGVALSHEHWIAALKLRIQNFNERMLDDLLLTGEFLWWRPAAGKAVVRSITAKTRYMILSRELWYRIAPAASEAYPVLSPDARRVYDYLAQHGASFLSDVHHASRLFSEQTLRGIRELVAQGLATSDQFFALRYLVAGGAKPAAAAARQAPWSRARTQFPAGRFALVRFSQTVDDAERAVAIAEMQLARQGIIYRYAAEQEFFRVPWPKLVRALRLMEMRGLIRGGRFIDGLWGEQFAEPHALSALGSVSGYSIKEAPLADPIGLVRRQLTRLGTLGVAIPARTA